MNRPNIEDYKLSDGGYSQKYITDLEKYCNKLECIIEDMRLVLNVYKTISNICRKNWVTTLVLSINYKRSKIMELKKTKNGTHYIDNVKFMDLIRITGNGFPICDCCRKDLIGYNDLILVPILNEVYCKECGKKELKQIKYYEEDREIEERRTSYYCDVLGIKE